MLKFEVVVVAPSCPDEDNPKSPLGLRSHRKRCWVAQTNLPILSCQSRAAGHSGLISSLSTASRAFLGTRVATARAAASSAEMAVTLLSEAASAAGHKISIFFQSLLLLLVDTLRQAFAVFFTPRPKNDPPSTLNPAPTKSHRGRDAMDRIPPYSTNTTGVVASQPRKPI